MQNNPKIDENSLKQKIQPVKTKIKKNSKPKIKLQESLEDPMDLLSQDFDIIDQTAEKFSSVDKESSKFHDTIIGSGHMKNPKLSKPFKKSPNKENKVPSLNLKSTVKKFNNPSVINIEESEDDLIEMLISEEEEEIQKESIIKLSENSLSKKTPVKISRSLLKKVDPMQRYKEMMRNSQKSKEAREGFGKVKNYSEAIEVEESVKLEDIASRNNKKGQILQEKNAAGANSHGMKNIFFDINSQKDMNENEV